MLAKAAGAEPAGQMRDEKLHAVVARSTFPSQNVQNTSGADHFWQLRCRKSARRCGAKHMWKSKCTKHTRCYWRQWNHHIFEVLPKCNSIIVAFLDTILRLLPCVTLSEKALFVPLVVIQLTNPGCHPHLFIVELLCPTMMIFTKVIWNVLLRCVESTVAPSVIVLYAFWEKHFRDRLTFVHHRVESWLTT